MSSTGKQHELHFGRRLWKMSSLIVCRQDGWMHVCLIKSLKSTNSTAVLPGQLLSTQPAENVECVAMIMGERNQVAHRLRGTPGGATTNLGCRPSENEGTPLDVVDIAQALPPPPLRRTGRWCRGGVKSTPCGERGCERWRATVQRAEREAVV